MRPDAPDEPVPVVARHPHRRGDGLQIRTSQDRRQRLHEPRTRRALEGSREIRRLRLAFPRRQRLGLDARQIELFVPELHGRTIPRRFHRIAGTASAPSRGPVPFALALLGPIPTSCPLPARYSSPPRSPLPFARSLLGPIPKPSALCPRAPRPHAEALCPLPSPPPHAEALSLFALYSS